MDAAQKKQEEKIEEKAPEVKAEKQKSEEKSTQEIIASNVVIKTTGDVEVIDETAPQEEKKQKEDPLVEFKEKMNKEEHSDFQAPAKKNFMWPILFIFIIAICLLAGVFFYKNGINNKKIDVEKSSPTPVVTVEPTKAIDLTQYEIEVLNGSEVNGGAGRQKANLEEEGFTVSSVGNADNTDYTDTVIKAKAEVDKAFVNKLKTFLEDSFTVVKEELSDDASVPVIVILGTKK
jgi:hypothetical protein